MNKRLIALAAGALTVALIMAGCGGGDDDEATASSITRAQFIKQADAACEKSVEQIPIAFGAFVEERKSEGDDLEEATEKDFAEVVDAALIPSIEQEINEIRALGTPDGDEVEIEAFLDALEEGVETAEQEPKLAAQDSTKIFGASSELAKEYGLKDCATR